MGFPFSLWLNIRLKKLPHEGNQLLTVVSISRYLIGNWVYPKRVA